MTPLVMEHLNALHNLLSPYIDQFDRYLTPELPTPVTGGYRYSLKSRDAWMPALSFPVFLSEIEQSVQARKLAKSLRSRADDLLKPKSLRSIGRLENVGATLRGEAVQLEAQAAPQLASQIFLAQALHPCYALRK